MGLQWLGSYLWIWFYGGGLCNDGGEMVVVVLTREKKQ